jgi:hypothetical protein
VIAPSSVASAALERLRQLAENYLRYVDGSYPGGCFFASLAAELDEDPVQLTFELEAYLLLANAQFVVRRDSAPLDRARPRSTVGSLRRHPPRELAPDGVRRYATSVTSSCVDGRKSSQ